MTPPPTTPTRATNPSTPTMTKAARCWPSERPVRAQRHERGHHDQPEQPEQQGDDERHRRSSFSVLGVQQVGEQVAGQPTGPALVDQPGRLGALADGRLADPETAARLDVGQPLVQRVDDLPAAVGAAFEEAGPQPEHRLQLLSTVVLATDSDPVRHGLGPGDGVAGVQVRRAATGPGVGGQRLLDGPDPDPDRPAAGPQQGADRGDGRPGVGEHRLHLVADGALEGPQPGPGASASRSSRSGTSSACERLSRWSTVSTTTIPASSSGPELISDYIRSETYVREDQAET